MNRRSPWRDCKWLPQRAIPAMAIVLSLTKAFTKFSMTDPPVSFGDNVRIIATPETESAGIADLTGQVSGYTTPSVTNVDVIGDLREDFAINVHIEELDQDVGLVAQLVEFVDHGVGTEITLDGVPKKWTRNADGGWDESPAYIRKSKRSFLSRLFGFGDRE